VFAYATARALTSKSFDGRRRQRRRLLVFQPNGELAGPDLNRLVFQALRGAPQVPGQPSFASALFSDLGGTSASGHSTLWCYPRKNNCEDSRGVGTDEAQSHGFCDHCLRFTAMVTHGHARLVSDCWPSFVGLDWLPTGSLRKVSAYTHSPFPSFAWRNVFIPPAIWHVRLKPTSPTRPAPPALAETTEAFSNIVSPQPTNMARPSVTCDRH